MLAASCHDYKHTGYNNNYQRNVQTDMAITHNDYAILENFHVSETFRTMLKIDNNLFARFSPEEYRHCRRRMIECILATDMESHAKHLVTMRSKLDALEINDGANVHKLIAGELTKKFENQQMILSQCVHTSDLSNPAKIPEVFDKWTELVFMEFFNQGDLEKSLGQPPSMLCDRETILIGNSQIGFIKYVVIPQFELMLDIVPELKQYLENVHTNLKRYEKIAEGEAPKARKIAEIQAAKKFAEKKLAEEAQKK
jgi:hypothetical protein